MNSINITINGKTAHVTSGTSILDAACELGIVIPTLCHEPGLKSQAQCRVCLVEVEGRPRLEPACATQISDGMTVYTESDRVTAARRMVLELLLSQHPKDCPGNSHEGGCKLCEYSRFYGIRNPSFGYGRRESDNPENAFISRNSSTCVLCSKCVRVCEQVQGISALAFMNRGNKTIMRPAFEKALEETDCEMCGNCTAVCPTGAIKPRSATASGEVRKVRTTCGFCGVGCQMDLNIHNGRVVGVTTGDDNPVNGKWLCVKGRFGHEFIHHPERLTQPLIRRRGQLEPASWDEAMGYMASRLKEIKAENGPDSIAFLSSSRCTNEENYLVQKLARAVIGTNSVDQCART